MSEEEEAKSATRLASDVISMAAEVLHLKPESGEKTETRSGPLVVIGRFYISLTLILAVATSASAYFDARSTPTWSVEKMRCLVAGCVLVGLSLGVLLICLLFKKHPMYLFSPTELSTQTQQSLMAPRSKGEAETVQPTPPANPGPKP